MTTERLFHYLAVIAALHAVLLSLFFGLRHIGYMLTATLSATLIWGVVFILNGQKRRVGYIVGIVVGLAIQQVAYQVWKTELPGFLWPLAQFGAVQCLIAYSIGRTTQ